MNLITGAAGHLGNVLARELVRRGESVRVLVLPGEDTSSLDGLPVEKVEGNILNPASLEKAFQGVDTVFHMAALVSLLEEHAPILYRVNVEGTLNVLQAARTCGVRRMVYTSSIHALARPPHGVPIDETLPFDTQNPAGAYDRTKAIASEAVRQAARSGLDAVIVCPTGVIGPYDFRRSEMGEMFLDWISTPVNWLIPGAFDFVDVRDVAIGHILARDLGGRSETYILGGEQISIPRLYSLVKEAIGSRIRAITLPIDVAMALAVLAEKYYRLARRRPRFTRYSIETLLSNSAISIEKARRQLFYSPRTLAESVRDTVAWWLENARRTRSTVRI